MEFFDVIRKRCSVRSYKPDPVEKEKLDMVLEAARLAPTACNLQSFKIIVISTEGKEEQLKKIYGRDWFVQAPYILGICSIPEKCWVRRDQKNYGDVDAAIVMEHMILAATDQGLGTCWIGAFDPKAAKQVLCLDDNLEPVAFTPLGYPKEPTVSRAKKSIEELVIYK